jgi:NAD-dependent dihydropyrimidine dehydrogenase PreA subunit
MKNVILSKFADNFFKNMAVLEAELAEGPGAVAPNEDSPHRFEIIQEKMKRGGDTKEPRIIPLLLQNLRGVNRSIKSLNENPARPKTHISEGMLREMEAVIYSLGACSIGYTRLPAGWVFKNKAALHPNAIVLTMKMDRDLINTAPSPDAEYTVIATYRDLGIIANKAADYLRAHGFSVQAGHPLNGQTLYPPLAQMAGLGQLAHSGLIITPEFGPCVRLSALYTSIENLPFNHGNPHAWIEGYCASCRLCVQKCPAQAIYSEPVRHASGRITYVDNQKCFPYFHDNHGCSVCIKVCPFNHVPYERLKEIRAPS